MATVDHNIHGWKDAADYLMRGRNRLARHLHGRYTDLIREGDSISVKYHDTNIVTYDGSPHRVTFNSGGWRTVTTKAKMNEYAPRECRINQVKGVWYFVVDRDGKRESYTFADGMTYEVYSGAVTGAAPKGDDKAQQKLGRKINAYVKRYMDALMSGQIPAPSSGDCWMCALRNNEGKTLGEQSNDSGHIMSHIDENYYVPSLIYNALEAMGSSMVDQWTLTAIFDPEHPDSAKTIKAWGDVARRDFPKRLRRYIRRQLGMTSSQ